MHKSTTKVEIENYSKNVQVLITQPPSFWLQWGNVLIFCLLLALFILSCFFHYEQSFTSRVAMPELKYNGQEKARVKVYLPIEKKTEFLSDSVTVKIQFRGALIEGKVIARTELWKSQKEEITVEFYSKEVSELSKQVVGVTWVIQKGTILQMLMGNR